MITPELIRKNREEARRLESIRTEKRKARQRNAQRKKRYGLPVEDFEHMLEDAGYACEICRRPVMVGGTKGDPALANVDHCHVSGTIRGILCGTCNKALGQLGDTICSIEAVLMYLRKAHVREI